MSLGIIGIGSAVPANVISQAESCRYAKIFSGANESQSKLLEHIYRRTSISERSTILVRHQDDDKTSVDFFQPPKNAEDRGPSTAERLHTYNLHAANLSNHACRAALENAGIEASQITHLITVSCTGFAAPGFDLQLIDSLSMNRDVFRTHIGFMGCHGAMNALRVAQGYCAVNEGALVLLCATEICSLHYQYGWGANDILANSLFADGSAVLILGNRSAQLHYSSSKSFVIPHTQDAITWHISNHGFVMTLSPEVSNLVYLHLPALLNDWLNEHSLTLQDISSWAVHPGGPRILNAVQMALGLPSHLLDSSRQILAQYGNMSSPTVFFILEQLLKSPIRLPCVMLGFGPGMTIEAALFI